MDDKLLAKARRAQERLIDAQRDAAVARAEFHRVVRDLHVQGASLRELAVGLGLSHQRVHQIVEEAGGSRRRGGGIPFQPLPCTFCGKQQAEAGGKLVAGPGVCICEGCTGLAETVISQGEAARTPVGQLNAVPEDQTRAQCGFCGKYRHQVPGLAVSSAQTDRKEPARICSECLSLCDEIFDESPSR